MEYEGISKERFQKNHVRLEIVKSLKSKWFDNQIMVGPGLAKG